MTVEKIWPIIASAVALLISCASLVVSFLSYRRAGDTIRAEHRIRLQLFGSLFDQRQRLRERGDPDAEILPDVIVYSGNLVNSGLKPIHFLQARVQLIPHNREEPVTYSSHSFDAHLATGEKSEVLCAVEWDWLKSLAAEHSRDSVDFWVKIDFQDSFGNGRELSAFAGRILKDDGGWKVKDSFELTDMFDQRDRIT